MLSAPDRIAAAAEATWGALVRTGEVPAALGDPRAIAMLEPPDSATAAAMLQWADAERLAVVPVGGATKLPWGGEPRRLDVLFSTRRLVRGLDHCAGDLTAVVPGGMPLAECNAALAREGQWLPLDPLWSDRATIGGIVATHDSGPRRLRFGAPRDLIIGIEVATTDGRLAKAGGRVVKNVAGYDLPRMLCGSMGALAVITSATFKLAPRPAASRTLVATAAAAGDLIDAGLALSNAPLTPSAIELADSPPRLLVRFETTAAAADRQAVAARALCTGRGLTSEIADDADEPAIWRSHADRLSNSDGALLKLSVLPAAAKPLLAEIDRAGRQHGVTVQAAGRVALAILMCRVQGPAEGICALVSGLRATLEAGRGSLVVLDGPRAVKGAVPIWGTPGPVQRLAEAVKRQFDPHGTLNPGRGPFGL